MKRRSEGAGRGGLCLHSVFLQRPYWCPRVIMRKKTQQQFKSLLLEATGPLHPQEWGIPAARRASDCAPSLDRDCSKGIIHWWTTVLPCRGSRVQSPSALSCPGLWQTLLKEPGLLIQGLSPLVLCRVWTLRTCVPASMSVPQPLEVGFTMTSYQSSDHTHPEHSFVRLAYKLASWSASLLVTAV